LLVLGLLWLVGKSLIYLSNHIVSSPWNQGPLRPINSDLRFCLLNMARTLHAIHFYNIVVENSTSGATQIKYKSQLPEILGRSKGWFASPFLWTYFLSHRSQVWQHLRLESSRISRKGILTIDIRHFRFYSFSDGKIHNITNVLHTAIDWYYSWVTNPKSAWYCGNQKIYVIRLLPSKEKVRCWQP
jgi:hypothetical protein